MIIIFLSYMYQSCEIKVMKLKLINLRNIAIFNVKGHLNIYLTMRLMIKRKMYDIFFSLGI